MDNSFFTYLQQLELIAFFSGYPLLYAFTIFLTGNSKSNPGIKKRIASLLPFAYALTGTLYLGLQLKNLYPNYSIENIKLLMLQPFLIIWGLLSLLFWIPALSKKPILSLLHSLVFFFFLTRDLFLHTFQSNADKNVIRNDMKIYTDSLLLNLGTFTLILILSFFIYQYRKRTKSKSVN